MVEPKARRIQTDSELDAVVDAWCEKFGGKGDDNPEPDPLAMKANVHIVEFVPEGYEDKYPYKVGDHVLLIEIENMPGHCAVITTDGRIVWAYHTGDFRKLTREEM
jgi:hypothetical protein